MVVAQWFGPDRMDELIEAKTGALRRAEPALAVLAVRRAAHPEDSALIGAAVRAWAVDQATAAGSWAKLDGPSDTDTSEPPSDRS